MVDLITVAVDDVNHTRGEARFVDQAGESERSEGSDFRGLHKAREIWIAV